MKSFLISVIALFSISALANVQLGVGDSVTVGGQVVTCGAGSGSWSCSAQCQVDVLSSGTIVAVGAGQTQAEAFTATQKNCTDQGGFDLVAGTNILNSCRRD